MASDVACPAASDSKAAGDRAGSGRRLDSLLLVGSLVFFTTAVFYRVVQFQFLTWDDDIHVTKNPLLDPVSAASVLQFWLEPYGNLYVPLSYTFFAAEAWLSELIVGRLDPRVFHTGCLLLHLACVRLVFQLLSRLIANPLAAWAGALCFAVHPLQVESVAWIGETRGLLSALFSLLALLWYLPPREQGESTAAPGASDTFSARRYGWASAAFVAAVLSKPAAASLPLVALALDLLWLRRGARRSLGAMIPWLALALLDIGITKLLQSDERISNRPDWWLRPVVAGDALSFYLRKLILPRDLVFDYARTPAAVLSTTAWYRAWLLPGAVLGLALASRQRRLWLTAGGIFVAGLLPVLGLVPFLYQDISTVADRYVYLPMLGVSLALAAWLERHWSRPMFACAGFMLGALGFLAWQQTATWRHDLTLFGHAVEVNPRSKVAQYMLGTALVKSGQTAAAQDHFRMALELDPHYALAHNDLGVTLLDQGKTDAALKEIHAALAANPRYATAHASLGNALVAKGEFAAAVKEFQQALVFDPRFAPAYVSWGKLLLEHGAADDNAATPGERQNAAAAAALERFRQALAANPRLGEAHFWLAQALLGQGKSKDAERELLLALRYDPRLAQAHNNLGAMYFREHRLAEAAAQCEAALKLDPDLVEAHFNRGCIFIEQGNLARGLADF
ncbi:MAG TPA: tetratricopeptide repeat protein, partial [Pirellulales bacterium]|nr:tetratricopeptide repeat protein [Pirellulales bacterium]